jgi:hypothetical protein
MRRILLARPSVIPPSAMLATECMKSTLLFASILLAVCAGQSATPEQGGRFGRFVDPVSGTPLAQMTMPNASACKLVLDEIRTRRNVPNARTASCMEIDVASGLPFWAAVVFVDSGILFQLEAATMDSCVAWTMALREKPGYRILTACGPK